LPEVNEELAKTYGIESGSVDDLRKDIAANMERELVAKSKAEAKRQLLEGLLVANPIDIPDEAFLEALIQMGVDTNGDGIIGKAEAEATTIISIYTVDNQRECSLNILRHKF